MKTISFMSLALSAALLAGCHTTAGTSVVLNHDNGGSVVYEGNTRLHNEMSVTAVTYDKVPAGLNRVNIQLTSLVQRELHLQYRIAWFNAEGMEIDGDARTYRPLTLQGLDSVTVTGVANHPSAVTSRLRVREMRAADHVH
ncbi:MAG: DUF1425 domain-containing protein [Kiritimatiellae bacterium]|nr:DUF1425 domain-containing protein [Kiritimatiellia bacterium]